MIPGMSEMMGGNEEEAGHRMKRIAFIFDSMTTAELDSDGSPFHEGLIKPKAAGDNGKDRQVGGADGDQSPREPNKRILRVARGSGTSVQEVEELLSQHQMFSGMVKKAGGKSGWYVFCSSLSTTSLSVRLSRMTKMQQAGGRGGAGGRPGMPPVGPNGMPDLSSMSPLQRQKIEQMMQSMGGPGGGMGGMAEMMKAMGGGGGMGGMADMMKGLMGGMGGQ